MYIMNYLDRNNIAAARLTGKKGLQKDLGMTDTQYQVGWIGRMGGKAVLMVDRLVSVFCLWDICSCVSEA